MGSTPAIPIPNLERKLKMSEVEKHHTETADPAEARRLVLKSLDKLRAMIVAGEIRMLLACGITNDNHQYTMAHVPPGTPFTDILQAAENMVSRVAPVFVDREAAQQTGEQDA